jgi:hypothetical protein
VHRRSQRARTPWRLTTGCSVHRPRTIVSPDRRVAQISTTSRARVAKNSPRRGQAAPSRSSAEKPCPGRDRTATASGLAWEASLSALFTTTGDRDAAVVADCCSLATVCQGSLTRRRHPHYHRPATVQVDADILLYLHAKSFLARGFWFRTPEFCPARTLRREGLRPALS